MSVCLSVSMWKFLPGPAICRVHSWPLYNIDLRPQGQIYRFFDMFLCLVYNNFLIGIPYLAHGSTTMRGYVAYIHNPDSMLTFVSLKFIVPLEKGCCTHHVPHRCCMKNRWHKVNHKRKKKHLKCMSSLHICKIWVLKDIYCWKYVNYLNSNQEICLFSEFYRSNTGVSRNFRKTTYLKQNHFSINMFFEFIAKKLSPYNFVSPRHIFIILKKWIQNWLSYFQYQLYAYFLPIH